MATKAELEAELSDLKAQLAKNKAQAPSPVPAEPDADADQDGKDGKDATEDLFELPDGVAKDLIHELETFATEKPIVSLLAVFVIGYALGRAR